MNDEFPLTIIERCQTCSILMLNGISALHPEWQRVWLHHIPFFMDRICLLLVPVETEVYLQILQTNKVCSDSTHNDQVKTSVCPINFDESFANVTLFSSRKILPFWKVFGCLRVTCILTKAYLQFCFMEDFDAV